MSFSRSVVKMSAGWKNIKYRQDMPPPGGYGAVPYKRNLPVRGLGGFALFGLGIGLSAIGVKMLWERKVLEEFTNQESHQAELVYYPLLQAEKDRTELRLHKEKIESEALNIVGTGFDPTYEPGMGNVYHTPVYEPPLMESLSPFWQSIRLWYQPPNIEKLGP
nr:NADH dehydrogenase [ubiquinone] 1 alpha subcomplex subunit 13-like [Ciona intestinalis]|eukprot:XP_009858984.1 NADH dehydrogenase [ubiquinone] 1 alpha subcomplex subunit 13-like [Ciona intestinalis]